MSFLCGKSNPVVLPVSFYKQELDGQIYCLLPMNTTEYTTGDEKW